MLLLSIEWSMPLKNPVLIFSVVLFIILFAPIVLQRLRIPGIIGLIMAGVLVGPNGINLLLRDASIELFGTVGLLYIMFLVGLEVDLNDFKRHRKKSIVFGLFTFGIPLLTGYLAGYFILGFTHISALLFGLLLAPHTMLAYPIASRFGLSKILPVNITVGGTIIADTLALVLLAVIAGTSTGEVDAAFWLQLVLSVAVFGFIVFWVFPRVGTWFFKQVEDSVSQYIFVLAMAFLGGFLAEIAGLEAIIGAFMAGLALNRLIPHTSPLMNRIEFVGNALFIPFFLIGVGMLVDLKLLFEGPNALIVAGTMTLAAILSKWLAAWLSQQVYGLSKLDRKMIFGLSVARAAATLAAVLVGFNLGLLTEDVFNGTILMILATCLVGSFAVEQAARQLARQEAAELKEDDGALLDRLLVPLSNPENVTSLIDFAVLMKDPANKNPIYALSVVNEDDAAGAAMQNGKKILEQATVHAAATERKVEQISRVDVNITNGIVHSAKEHKITDIIIGWNPKPQVADKLFGGLMENLLHRTEQTVVVTRSIQPLNTIKRLVVVVPPDAILEPGFYAWLRITRLLAKQIDAKMVFYGSETLKDWLDRLSKLKKTSFDFEHHDSEGWESFLKMQKAVVKNDLVVVISARKGTLSYQSHFERIPAQLSKHFVDNSFCIIFPEVRPQADDISKLQLDPTLSTPIQQNLERLSEVGKFVSKVLKR